ncbi:MAG TPA: peroxiredoxin, partial [Rhodospirillaceae bacterium]|nr:peroxiredoxin [Rhodospirillaceae bacterium]
YAMIVEDGTVTHFALETEPGLNVSSAEQILAALG